jgi:hypothetical protein
MLRRGKTDQAQLEIDEFVNENLEEVYEEVKLLDQQLFNLAIISCSF